MLIYLTEKPEEDLFEVSFFQERISLQTSFSCALRMILQNDITVFPGGNSIQRQVLIIYKDYFLNLSYNCEVSQK